MCRRPYAAFDGEGARLAGGRWNRRGTAVVYTSATLSLAALEYFVHLETADAPADLVAIPADVPDGVSRRRIDVRALPPDWRRYPAPESLADFGMAWLREGRTALLIVPSVVVPSEANYLINPAHSECRVIRAGAPNPFSLDPRLWGPRESR